MQASSDLIVAAFFEAAALPEQWPDALQLMADSFDCRGVLLTTQNLSPAGIIASHHMGDVLGRFHDQQWNERDLRTERAIAAIAAVQHGFVRDQDILSSDEIEGSDYYRGFARPAGVGYFAAALLVGRPGDFVALSLQRDQRHGAISDGDKARLDALLPALKRSAQLAQVLRERTMAALFDRRPDSRDILLLLDLDGRVRRGEEGVQSLAAAGLHIIHGSLRGRHAQSDVAIAKALNVINAGRATVMLTTDPTGRPLAKVSFSPVVGRARDLLGRGDILVRVAPVGQPQHDVDLVSRLAQLFSLTQAEQRVLLPLLSGAETNEIARASGYTRESVRTWIKSILLKSGCHSRASLLAFARRFDNS